MRTVVGLMLAGLVATGCQGTANPNDDSRTNQGFTAETEELRRPYAVKSPEDWPAPILEASTTLRTDVRHGLDLVGRSTYYIEPSVASLNYPSFTPCGLYPEADGLIQEGDYSSFTGIEMDDLDDLAEYWTEAGYTVTMGSDNADGDQTRLLATKPGVGEINVLVFLNEEGLDQSSLWFGTECHPLLSVSEDDGN